MTCDEVRPLIGAHIDGELDAAHSEQVAAHLKSCSGCESAYTAQVALSSKIRSSELYSRAPDTLRERLAQKLPQPKPARQRRPFAWQLTFAAGLAAGIFIAVLVPRLFFSTNSGVAADAVASHVHSLMADHLMDVPSTNQHTVKPWFDGKIDFSPPVPNLAEIGYPLLGGRLDNIEGRPAAALVYQRRKHYVNVFVMTQADGAPPASYEHNGYHVKGWRSGGLDFLAVSDIGADELGQFAQQFRKADHE